MSKSERRVVLDERAERAYSVQSYAPKPTIEGVEIVRLQRFNDDGGSITELGRLTGGQHDELAGFEVAQINYSELEPGAIKAFHMHYRQTDVWYVPPCDRVLLVLSDCRDKSPTEDAMMRFVLGDGNSTLVRIPPGVAHGCRNIGATTARIVYMVDVKFSTGEDCDEGRLPWDYLGAEVWELARE